MYINYNGEKTFITYLGAAHFEGYVGKNCRPSVSELICSKGTFVEYEINQLLFEAEISSRNENYIRQCCRLEIRGYRKTDYEAREPKDSRSFDEVRADMAIELCEKMIKEFKNTAEWKKDMYRWFVAGLFGIFSFSISFCLYEIRQTDSIGACIFTAICFGVVLTIIGLIAKINEYIKIDRTIFASILGVALMFWSS